MLVDSGAGARKLRPAKAYWDFGVANVIRNLNKDPDFVNLKHADAEDPDPRGYFASGDRDRLQAEYPNFAAVGNGYFEIGGDFGQVFEGKQHSTGIIGIRCAALPFAERSQERFVKPLLIIPGPDEPANLQPYLQDTVEFFAEHGPGGVPFRFQERTDRSGPPRDAAETLWLLGHTATHLSAARQPTGRAMQQCWHVGTVSLRAQIMGGLECTSQATQSRTPLKN